MTEYFKLENNEINHYNYNGVFMENFMLDRDYDKEKLIDLLNTLSEEKEQLKKELHLMHIRTMFSTVQSFKGDVSERYRYSKETDTIYDTANHYGQYRKVLDKVEIVILLNEYETVLNELDSKYVNEFALPETLQLELQRIENENEQLKSAIKESIRISELNGALSPMRLKSIFYHFEL